MQLQRTADHEHSNILYCAFCILNVALFCIMYLLFKLNSNVMQMNMTASMMLILIAMQC